MFLALCVCVESLPRKNIRVADVMIEIKNPQNTQASKHNETAAIYSIFVVGKQKVVLFFTLLTAPMIN